MTAVGFVINAWMGSVFLHEQVSPVAMGRCFPHMRRSGARGVDPPRNGKGPSMKWLLLALVVLSTVVADLFQSHAMRQGGKKWKLPLAVAAMAVSFFSFTELLKVADLSFAVPASAASLSLEVLLARLILKEMVNGQRWAGAALVAFGVILLAQ